MLSGDWPAPPATTQRLCPGWSWPGSLREGISGDDIAVFNRLNDLLPSAFPSVTACQASCRSKEAECDQRCGTNTEDDNVEECPVCLTTFDDTLRRPRNLPCGHTVCSPCIDGLKQQGAVMCPTCRASHAVPEAGQFSISYAVEGLVDNLRKEALALENKMEHHIATNKDFWSIVVKSLPGVKKKRVFTQVRELKVEGRKIVSCPMPFCIGKVKNMTRHLCQVHGVVNAVQQRNLMKKTTTPKADSSPRRKSLHRCSVCDKVLSRIDSHLVSKHGLKRGTARFKELLSASILTKGDQEEEPLDAQDPDLGKKVFKVFLERYKRYLQNTSALSHNSFELSVRIISDVIKYSFKVQKDSFQEKALINVFLNLGNDESFLKRRAGTLSGSYCSLPEGGSSFQECEYKDAEEIYSSA
ncbi:hypothetical protein O3P69_019799 [Scylla paramamosain]|uniref:RING-type domain-containing protein n=1 Tax=Scylla paramamosain TaxID=85552 RepID=A0AAW0SXE5_SCYPA